MDSEKRFIYSENLNTIPQVLDWSVKQDVERFRRFLVEQPNIPLYCFSSGGASSTLHYVALLYETNRGMAKSLTGLAISSISDEALKSSKILIYSKSGNGVDTKNLVNRATAINPKGVGGLSRDNGEENYLICTLKKFTTNWFQYKFPGLKGSFISTTSNIAAMCLVYKAFTGDSDIASKLHVDVTPSNCFSYITKMGEKVDMQHLSNKKHFIALYSGWGEPSARDFESKMVESGIASVQLSDIRNFCHGRFIFVSNHFEETVFVLFLTPREKEFAQNLIFKGTAFNGKDELFPQATEIIIIETEHDSPLATIDLVIKESVLVAEIGKVVDIDPYSPPNPYSIDKRVAIHEKYTETMKQPLRNTVIQGKNGELRSVNRKKVINYDPEKSIAELAKKNGVSVATVRKYIVDKNIDRNRDEKLNKYNAVWKEYIKDSDIPKAALARKLKMSVNTVNLYLGMEAKDIIPEDGKIGMAIEHPRVKELRKEIPELQKRFERFCKVRDKYPDLSASEYLKRLHWTDDKKGNNLSMVANFMQMKEFRYRFKRKAIEYMPN